MPRKAKLHTKNLKSNPMVEDQETLHELKTMNMGKATKVRQKMIKKAQGKLKADTKKKPK